MHGRADVVGEGGARGQTGLAGGLETNETRGETSLKRAVVSIPPRQDPSHAKPLFLMKNLRPSAALHPLALAALLTLVPIDGAQAANKHWSCQGTAAWSNAACWINDQGAAVPVPAAGDTLYIYNHSTGAMTVNYGIDPNLEYAEVLVGSSGVTNAGVTSLNVNSANARLRTKWMKVTQEAKTGTAMVNHSAGRVDVAQTLLVRDGISSATLPNGIYNLSGGALNTGATELRVESDWEGGGTSRFNQTGGTHTTGRLSVLATYATYTLTGANSVLNAFNLNLDAGKVIHDQAAKANVNYLNLTGGLYTLSGASSVLDAAGDANFAALKMSGGTFVQNDGTVQTANTLHIGGADYVMHKGTLKAGSAYFTRGEFQQLGGTVQFNGYELSGSQLGAVSHLMSGGTLSSAGLWVAGSGNATFTQLAGMHTVSTSVVIDGKGSPLFRLQGGTLSSGSLVVGDVANGVFEQTAGSHVTGGAVIGKQAGGVGSLAISGGSTKVSGNTQLGVAGQGTLTLTGGSFETGTLAIGSQGQVLLNGGSLLAGSIAQDGRLVVSKDTQLVANMKLGALSRTQLDANLTNAGTLTLTRNLLNEHGITGSATLINHASGTITGTGSIETRVSNAGILQSKGGDLTLAGATFHNTGLVRNGVGSNLFINAPTLTNLGHVQAQAGGSLVFSANLSVQADKSVQLLGGILATPKLSNYVGGTVSGFGTIVGDVRNLGKVTFYGPTTIVGSVVNEVGGDLLVRNDQTLITGDLVNHGTLRTIGGKVVYEGTFTNLGAYISDPSENHFVDLVVGEHGYLAGEAGDRFIITGSLVNGSTEAALWNTAAASLVFAGEGDKLFTLAGSDLGLGGSGYANNFAWGGLTLAGGARLVLQDANAVGGAALYVGGVEGALIDGDRVLNITGNGYNVYYDASLAANAYLGGRTYGLGDGGVLIAAAAVPEPESYVLLLAGLGVVGLLAYRRSPRQP